MPELFERPPVECAHVGCNLSAIVKIRTKTGMASLCDKHYSGYFQNRAEKKCVELGLLTNAQCREWLKANRLKSMSMREALARDAA